jgi:iron complex outermembrane receptor protein
MKICPVPVPFLFLISLFHTVFPVDTAAGYHPDTPLHVTLMHTTDTILLEDVTVSVMPLDETYSEATGSIYMINTNHLEPGQMVTSAGLFGYAPGVHMSTGSYNTNRLVIRGVGSRTPYSTNRIRAYLDDIPLTSGDGISTLEDLDLNGIGIMEILKGPASALYGSGLGGVVKLNSPYPENSGFGVRITGNTGTFRTRKLGVLSSIKSDKIAFSGGLFTTRSEGFRENSEYSRENLFFNVRYFSERNIFSLTASLISLKAEIPSSLNETDFTSEPWRAASNWKSVEGFEDYMKALAGFRLESVLSGRLKNHLVLYSAFTDPYERRPFNTLDDRTYNMGFREYLQLDLSGFKFHTGLEYFHEWYNWKIYETARTGQGGLVSDHAEVRRYINLFTQFQWRYGRRLLLDGGFNLNLLRYGLETVYRVDSVDQSGTYRYNPVLSPRIGISYRHHQFHHLYTSAGHGFSAPSLEETLLPEGSINTELKPETGWNLEIGHRGRTSIGRFSYDVTLYTIILHDLLVTERITEEIFTGINAGKALFSGVELLSRFSLHPGEMDVPYNLEATLGYTLSRNRFLDFTNDGVDYSGNALPGIPSQKLSSMISGRYRTIGFRLQSLYTGNQWMNDANDRKYEGYHLLHLLFSWNYKPPVIPFGMEIIAGIRNLLDRSYASMLLINAPSFGGNQPRYYYPGLPRRFHLGISISFQEGSNLHP